MKARTVAAARAHRAVIVFALLMYGAILALRFAVDGVEEGITLLFTLPIALLAFRFGSAGGLAGAGLAVVLLGVWDSVEDVGLDLLAYLTRATAFCVMGLAVGEMARRYRAQMQELGQWFSMSNDLVCVADLEGQFLNVNGAWERTLGYRPEELTSRPFIEFVHPEDVEATTKVAQGLGESPSEVLSFENRYRTRNGSWRWLLWSARSDDARIYAVAKDITNRKHLEQERERLLSLVEAQARTDDLTGLPNRRAWYEELRREVGRARRHGHPLAVVMLDLDRFKAYNDEHGHPGGDQLLRDAAREWRLVLRVTDFLARHGGEEFVALLPECPPHEAFAAIERLRDVTPGGQTVSAGIAYFDGKESPDELVARADAALYSAKHSGRDRTVTAAYPGAPAPGPVVARGPLPR